ncbi:unnamed protein product [Cercospora beticola]|nr:unnamed protein product [Cercospora beticola]
MTRYKIDGMDCTPSRSRILEDLETARQELVGNISAQRPLREYRRNADLLELLEQMPLDNLNEPGFQHTLYVKGTRAVRSGFIDHQQSVRLFATGLIMLLDDEEHERELQAQVRVTKQHKELAKKQGCHKIPAMDMYTGPSHDMYVNRRRIMPGKMTLRVRKVERMRSRRIPFTSPEYVPSSGGAIHDGPYTCIPIYIVGNYVCVLVFTSKQKTGFSSVHEDEQSRYVQVETEGSAFQKDPRSSTVLFVRGMNECEGSMLCLTKYFVRLDEEILIDYVTRTEESLVQLNDLIIEDKSGNDGMAGFLEGCDISEATAQAHRGVLSNQPEEDFALKAIETTGVNVDPVSSRHINDGHTVARPSNPPQTVSSRDIDDGHTVARPPGPPQSVFQNEYLRGRPLDGGSRAGKRPAEAPVTHEEGGQKKRCMAQGNSAMRQKPVTNESAGPRAPALTYGKATDGAPSTERSRSSAVELQSVASVSTKAPTMRTDMKNKFDGLAAGLADVGKRRA